MERSWMRHSVLAGWCLIALAWSGTGAEAQETAETKGWIEFRSFSYGGADPAWQGMKQAEEYLNPILAGFYPDPSIVRTGDDYYLVNSSFAWYPGVPIFHSKDLVNWTQIGHVLDRPEQLPLDGAGVSGGIFAPTIRYHNGRYYMITTNVTGGGNFYVTAEKPEGPWSNRVMVPEINGIDPSLFFDADGKAYIVHNGPPPENRAEYPGHRAIWLFEFDEAKGKVILPGKIIVNGGTDIAKKPVWIEGPHIFKKDGYYYLIAAEGGTEERHSEVVFRSKNIWGPYDSYRGNPILTQRTLPETRKDPITSTGHADFVETQKGEWWAVFLGVQPYGDGNFNTGRQTFLLPVSWKDGWPVILENGAEVPRVHKRPALPIDASEGATTHGSFVWTDIFQGRRLAFPYNLLRTPSKQWYSLSAKRGSLLIEPQAEDLDSLHNLSLIGHRQQHADFGAVVQMQLNPEDIASDAGIVAFQNEKHSYFLGVRTAAGGNGESGSRTVFLEKRDGQVTMVASKELPKDTSLIQLRIRGNGKSYFFDFRPADKEWEQIGKEQDGTILSTKVAGGFVGTYIGMFARRAK